MAPRDCCRTGLVEVMGGTARQCMQCGSVFHRPVNPVARVRESQAHRPRVVPNKKRYSRKEKHR